MSSRKLNIAEKKEFAKRFAEVCRTSEPAEISRLLDISYQAARNYLAGRLPDTWVLLAIAEKTPYSIHWLLTGRGEKFADNTLNNEEQIFFGKIIDAAKQGCLLALQELLVSNSEPDAPKTVVLESAKVRSEKSRENISSPTFSDEQK
jgi:hypothetical protein